MPRKNEHLDEPITAYARKDFAVLPEDLTVDQALQEIRLQGIGERIIYFYVVDAEGRLTGVLPTRRFLTAPPDQRLSAFMERRVLAIPSSVTVLEACEMFVLYKFLAFPVIDERRHIIGIIDVNLLRDEVFDITEPQEGDDVFEAIGFHIAQVKDASPLRAFRYRYPWLLTTIMCGTVCAFLAGAFEQILARVIVLAFFLTMVLALGESVAMQSMTVTIQALRSMPPTFRWYWGALRREMLTAVMLGFGCGSVVALIEWLWRGAVLPALVIGGSIVVSLILACLFGLTVPTILHAAKLDPKIAAGPVTLALTDICTLLCYFALASAVL